MAETWHITRSTRTCAATGKPIEAEEPFFSALVEDGDLFVRRDYSVAAWPEVDKSTFFSYWKSKGWSPKDADKAMTVDYDRLLAFYDDLTGAEEPHRRLFRYVVALMLTRKRILRLDSAARTPDGDVLVVFDRRGTGQVEVTAPEATSEQLARVQEQLNELFAAESDDEQ